MEMWVFSSTEWRYVKYALILEFMITIFHAVTKSEMECYQCKRGYMQSMKLQVLIKSVPQVFICTDYRLDGKWKRSNS